MLDANTTGQIFDISTRVHDLGDTALKIGVPIFFALITSLVTWFFTIKTTNKNHAHELIKLDKNYEQEITKLQMNYKQEIDKLEKTNQYETSKIKIQIKIKILEDAINTIDEYFIIARSIRENLLCIICILKIKDMNNLEKENNETYECIVEQLNRHNKILHNMVKASSKLKLIGFKITDEKIRYFSDLIREENNNFNSARKEFMNTEEYKKYVEEFDKRKEEYHKAINKDFENLK